MSREEDRSTLAAAIRSDSADVRGVARDLLATLDRADREPELSGPDAEMSDGAARMVASWWAAGMGIGQSFATTGRILGDSLEEGDRGDSSDVWNDLTDGGRCYESASTFDRLALNFLGTYLVARSVYGDPGPVAGWSDLWVDR